jgi:hypothetical protein
MTRSSVVVLALAAMLAGCGGSPGDLLAIDVTGGPANRKERIVVQDNGHATCNGGESQDLGSAALIDARQIEHDLKDLADRAATYEDAASGATSYTARTNDGTVRWLEGARGVPQVLPRTQLFALEQGRKLCFDSQQSG